MAPADFVHLHVHTEYSLLDAAAKVKPLVEKASELGFKALAMTDHGVMFGAYDFYQAARAKGVKPILGCEVYVAPGSRLDKKPGAGMRDVYHHLVLLARDDEGYRNLIKLVTAANLEGFYYKPRIDKELLAANAKGLIGLSGCLASEIPESIVKGDESKARGAIDWFKQTLGSENFYLELQNHGIPEQAKVNRALIPWAKEFGLKLVATNDVHYVEEGHWRAHDCLVCLGRQQQRDINKPVYQPGQFYLRSAAEMAARFSETPEAVLNTVEIGEKCLVTIKAGKGPEHYPVFAPPEAWTREGYLRQWICEGLARRYGVAAHVEGTVIVVDAVPEPWRMPTFVEGAPAPSGNLAPGVEKLPGPAAAAVQPLLDRLQLELGVIEKTGYVSYFLIVGDFVRYGRRRGISCVARGSAAGSLVTYLLEIANVDPLRYKLLFERFLNPERVSPPDIDIDFADDRRQEVIEYVREKYGRDAVAQIITFGTLGAKQAIRDVGRVLGLTFGDCDRLAKMITDLKWSLDDALQKNQEFRQACEDPTAKEVVELAQVLEDQARNASVHAAGVVIGAQPLVNLLPLKQDDEGGIVTQFAMNPVGELGLLKMDFLGLKTLTVLRNTVETIRSNRRIEVPIDALPLDDAPTYELLNQARTLGVFQLESGGMRDLCRKFQIASVEHITALISLYRPGPMDLIPDFIERRHGRKPVEHPHPLLKDLTDETYGVMIYQEQVMQAAQILAGFTLGGADLLRRAMGKKKPEEMDKQRGFFVKGCAAKEIPESEANRIFDDLAKFAGYGFNKSHAAAYAIVAYQTAYLKANYPVEFLCAMMTNDQGDLPKLSAYIAEARTFGIEVLGPDVNESDVAFAPAPGAGRFGSGRIRFGLAAIKGIGEAAVNILIEARKAGGDFKSLDDFCERIDTRALNRKAAECLVKAGALDSLGLNRATLFNLLEPTMARASSKAADRARGQKSLFDAFAPPEPAVLRKTAEPVEAPDWSAAEKLAYEKELLGIYMSGHPLDPHAKLLERYALNTIESLPGLPDRSVVRVGGLVTAVSEGVSKKNGKKFLLATVEDLTGGAQALVAGDNFEKFRPAFSKGEAVLVSAELGRGDDQPRLFPTEVIPLAEAPKKLTRQVFLRYPAADVDRARLEQAKALAESHPGPVPLFLSIWLPGGETAYLEADDRYRVNPTANFEAAISALLGGDAVHVVPDRTLPERPARKWERRSGGGGGDDE
jgi:DNA polymerase III subunit alpha